MNLTCNKIVEAQEPGRHIGRYVLDEMHHEILPAARVGPSVKHDFDRPEIDDDQMWRLRKPVFHSD